MAAEKLAVFNGPIRCCDPTTVNDIIKSVCILHNLVRKREGIEYRPHDTAQMNETTEVPTNIRVRDISIHEGSSATIL